MASKYESELNLEKTRAEDALEIKARFLSTMSHEIRTPLNAVVGLSYLLLEGNPKEEQVQNLNALNYSGKTLLTLVNDVLDFSKMEEDKMQLNYIGSDIKQIAHQIAKVHEPNCFKKEIKFKLNIDPNVPNVHIDPARFNQVLNNLISNSIKFTDSGVVSLNIKLVSDNEIKCRILFEIEDSGIGIPEDKFDHIFESFSQADASTSRMYGGTGLGLPIVKKIIEMMGGEIQIRSKVGEGSTFYFELELEKFAQNEIDDNNVVEITKFNNESVLLVEDNAINVMVAKQFLEKWGLNVEVAYNGLEAVDMVRKNEYKVVLMDLQMPEMDGYEACEEIRTFNKEIPILALSASVFVEIKDKVFTSGMNDFIYKPFDPIDLNEKIYKYMNKRA